MEPQQGATYHVEISAKAHADFEGLDSEALWAIHRALDALETDPQPPGARRRTAPGHYSLDVGLHRILYTVDEEPHLITIQRIRAHPPQRNR